MKIRINDLARELEVKSREILEVLLKVGVTEKKTHSSSIEEDEAARVRKYVLEQQGSGREVRHRASSDELRPKIDLSKISKPGDALKAIIEQKEHPPAALRSVNFPRASAGGREIPGDSTARCCHQGGPAPRRTTASRAGTACDTSGGAARFQTAFHYTVDDAASCIYRATLQSRAAEGSGSSKHRP